MTLYNPVEVAKLFDINTETVRRWIRSGELPAIRSSKKHGSLITEEELHRFVLDKPKYKIKLELKLN